jgi:hypothetical protein
VADSDLKANLHDYLQGGRGALLWKLEGLSEYEMRRPIVHTGTNLLGLVKHLAWGETGYFGLVFDRPFPETLPGTEDGEPNASMWVRSGETSQQIIDFYRRVWAHSDATIDALPLDAVGEVPWWPIERRQLTLHQALVHMIAETQRHAGHADLLREMIDGTAGLLPNGSNPRSDRQDGHV